MAPGCGYLAAVMLLGLAAGTMQASRSNHPFVVAAQACLLSGSEQPCSEECVTWASDVVGGYSDRARKQCEDCLDDNPDIIDCLKRQRREWLRGPTKYVTVTDDALRR